MLFLTSFCIYWYQIMQVMDKYNLMEKIVDIQLVFEPPPFPSITLCNLNPYRRSEVEQVPLVAKMLKAFDDVLTSAGKENKGHRKTRSADVMFEAAKSVCICESDSAACEALKEKPPEYNDRMCICAFDRHSGDAWPCYPEVAWGDITDCMSCNNQGYYRSLLEMDSLAALLGVCNQDASSKLGNIQQECLCQTIDDFCIAHKESHEMLNLWEYYGNVAPTEDPNFMKALGFEGMTDEVAIVTKAKENIVFAMATLPMSKRMELSMAKQDFVQKCSFNGKQCSIEHDFETRVDPMFGNCYTFNFNRTVQLMSSRAGPMFGLRMIVFVNASEYMPTTEAAGIKLTIHEKDEFPFPDLTGYNAPVGYTSSFGVRMKKMSRLPHPYGDCTSAGPPATYVYEGFDYSTEGCMRSCFQTHVLYQCECGDPRFPVKSSLGQKHCEAIDIRKRNCLDKYSKANQKGDIKCMCAQPCESSSFMVSYSAAVWPSPSLQVQLGLCDGDHEFCIQYYRDNGAMIEVFFEQLNYEYMSESPAYGFTNLLADFGGQFGLWLGVSVITCCEFVYLLGQVCFMIIKEQYKLWKKRQAEIAGKLAKKDAV